jgi:membrane associated rhomboid family serine protease
MVAKAVWIMKRVLDNGFFKLGIGARVLLLSFALPYLVALAGHYTQTFDLYSWAAFSPFLAWKGEVWRLLSYAFLPLGILDWLISLFWLSTLVFVLERMWSGRELWLYCLLSSLVASILLTLVNRPTELYAGNGAMILALIAAWVRFYGNERIILLGFGEMSVRQAALVVTIIEVLILVFTGGLAVTLAMLSGGFASWLYLFLRSKHALSRRSRVLDSERIARLEI